MNVTIGDDMTRTGYFYSLAVCLIIGLGTCMGAFAQECTETKQKKERNDEDIFVPTHTDIIV